MSFTLRDVEVTHVFNSGVYAKRMKLPRGHFAESHAHKFDHMSILAEGVARVTVDGKERTYFQGDVINIEAHKMHRIEAATDIVWFCIHATDECDPDKVDEQLIEGN